MREAATPWERLRQMLLTVGPGALWLGLFVLIPTLIMLVASLMSRGSLGQLVPPLGLHLSLIHI
ncbi:MAG: ABC transporter permease, partial [Meiothermus sp.]|nr:ABC transporter permease [Meiothermus sp.]